MTSSRLGLSEPIPAWRAWSRKLAVFGHVGDGDGGALPPEELQSRLASLERRALGSTLEATVAALWEIEQLSLRHATTCDRPWTLQGDGIPLVAGPPAHCGLAMAAVLDLGFDGPALRARLAERADPRFVFFSYESIGAMLALAERDLFGQLAALLGRSGRLRFRELPAVELGPFLAGFDEPERKFVAHGYGRLVYFKSATFGSTVRALQRVAEMPFGAAVRGAMAALGLVNCRDFVPVSGLVEEVGPDDLGRAVAGGFRNLVLLLEWSRPGVLDGLTMGPTAMAIAGEAAPLARQRRQAGEGPGLVA